MGQSFESGCFLLSFLIFTKWPKFDSEDGNNFTMKSSFLVVMIPGFHPGDLRSNPVVGVDSSHNLPSCREKKNYTLYKEIISVSDVVHHCLLVVWISAPTPVRC